MCGVLTAVVSALVLGPSAGVLPHAPPLPECTHPRTLALNRARGFCSLLLYIISGFERLLLQCK